MLRLIFFMNLVNLIAASYWMDGQVSFKVLLTVKGKLQTESCSDLYCEFAANKTRMHGTREKWPEYGSPAKYWTLT